MSGRSPKKKPRYEDSTLDRQILTTPKYSVEWTDGEGIVAIYSHGITERHVRDFADRLIEYLKRPGN